jgi:integrase/recombinase XerC
VDHFPISEFNPELSLSGIRSLVTSFLNDKSRSTLIAYQRDLKVFSIFLAVETVEEALLILFSSDHGRANFLILKYKSYLKEKDLQPTTINRRLSAIRSVVGLANLVGFISWKLQIKNETVHSYRDTRGPGKRIFMLMLKECENQKPPIGIRNAAILRLLYDLALRRGEVAKLDIEDLDFGEKRLSILGKGRTQNEYLTLPEPTILVLKNWLNIYPRSSGPLFVNFSRSRSSNERLSPTGIYKIVSQIGQRLGLKIRPHGLRHTAITEACKESTSV